MVDRPGWVDLCPCDTILGGFN